MVRAEREAVVETPSIKDLPFSSEARHAVFVVAPFYRKKFRGTSVSAANLFASLGSVEGTSRIFQANEIDERSLLKAVSRVDNIRPIPFFLVDPVIETDEKTNFGPDVEEVLLKAAEVAKLDNSPEIKPEHILIAFTKIRPEFNKSSIFEHLGLNRWWLESDARKSLAQEKVMEALKEWKKVMLDGGERGMTVAIMNDLAIYGLDLIRFLKDPEFVKAIKERYGENVELKDLI